MNIKHRLIVLSLIPLLAACGASLPERFYRLDALESGTASAMANNQRLSVGPVSVPDILDRPQMVWLVEAKRMVIAEQSRWAEPLPGAISRVVADNLARQVAGILPVAAHASADIRVELDIRRFDAVPGQGVTLEAVWMLRQAANAKQGYVLVRETVAAASTDALVAAHERALLGLSRSIAADLHDLPR